MRKTEKKDNEEKENTQTDKDSDSVQESRTYTKYRKSKINSSQ